MPNNLHCRRCCNGYGVAPYEMGSQLTYTYQAVECVGCLLTGLTLQIKEGVRLNNQQKSTTSYLYSDDLLSEEELSDEMLEQYIEKQKLKFYEEWFEYLDGFYQ